LRILAVVSGNWHPYMPPDDTDESLTRTFLRHGEVDERSHPIHRRA
jgi:hypothetical protein